MDYFINDEIFEHNNDELLQSPHLDSELWQNELISDLQNDNQFFNDQDFDLNQFTLTFDEENKIRNKPQTNTNIFQVSPERFPRGVSPDNQHNESPIRSTLKPVTFIHKRKSSLDSRETFDNKRFFFEQRSEDSASLDSDLIDKAQKSAFISPRVGSDRNLVTKFRKPDSIPLFQVTPNVSHWGDRLKYSLSPTTSSPDSAIDCSLNNGNQGLTGGEVSFLGYNNTLQNRLFELKYKSQKEESYSSKLANGSRLFQSPIPQTGVLILTEEEKRTLLTEGYQIPSRLPLTKQEERNLKKVRRKIKNKISAQESRRKKKEYIEALEKKVEIYAHENNDLRKKLENQENTNKSLLGQLRHLQHMLGRTSSSATSTCVMVFLLCFSLILVGIPEMNQPMKLPQSVLVAGNIHKFGYGSFEPRERSQMTGMQRYFPPDIDSLINTHAHLNNISENMKVVPYLRKNIGNEPLSSLESQVSGQRKSILLGSVKEEDDECVQYGPRYLWWLIQSPNLNADASITSKDTSSVENSVPLEFDSNVLATTVLSTPSTKNISTVVNDGITWSNSSDEVYRLAVAAIVT